MAASDIPIAALGVSDPATWGISGWVADIVPHLAYGLVTAIAYDAFTDRALTHGGGRDRGAGAHSLSGAG